MDTALCVRQVQLLLLSDQSIHVVPFVQLGKNLLASWLKTVTEHVATSI